jgi:WD40 repeat protein
MAFVDQLQAALATRGKRVWVDRTDIEPAADWSERITRGIEAAKAFIFVVTPESVISEQCQRELEIAVQDHKLIIPVALRDTSRRDLPGSLLRPNWIFFGQGDDAERGLDEVIRALEEDLDWRDIHTRLAIRTKEWAGSEQDRSFLLRGRDLRSAEEWLGQAALHEKTPPTALQTEYILASRKAVTRTQRTWRTALSAGLIISLALAALAFVQRQQAIHQRDIAVSDQLVAESQALGEANPTVSRLELIAAWGIHRSPQIRYAMAAAAANPEIASISSTTSINTVEFSPAGKILATGDDGGRVRLWDVTTHRQVGHSLNTAGRINSMAFSPDGKTLATTVDRGSLAKNSVLSSWMQLWDVATGHQIGHFTSAFSIYSVAFSPDGKTLAIGSADSRARLWDVATGRQIGHPLLTSKRSPIVSVAFSPDGKTLDTVSMAGEVELWDAATGRPIGDSFTPAPDIIDSAAFSPDGETMATEYGVSPARMWDVATGRPIGDPHLTGKGSSIGSVAFSPDGEMLATGDLGGRTKLWDVATGRQIGQTLAATPATIESVAFSPDGKTLATGGADGTTLLWDVTLIQQTSHPLVITNRDNSFKFFRSVAFSPDGKTLATGGADGTARLWDVATGRPIGRPHLTGKGSPIVSVAFSPDGKTLVTVTRAGEIGRWDTATGQPIGHFFTLAIASAIYSAAFSPDSRTLATGDLRGSAWLWNVATGRRMHHVSTSRGWRVSHPLMLHNEIWSVAFSPDGKTLATGDLVGTTRLWDVATGRQIGRPLAAIPAEIESVAFSPDGKTLATGDLGGTTRLWDVATGRQIGHPLAATPTEIDQVAFSPDGKTLATGDLEGTTRLWDVATSRQIGHPLTAPGGTGTVAFSPNSKTLATGGEVSPTVRLWNVSYLSNVLTRLCSQVGGSLTPAEWESYVPPGPAYRKICP